jgi:hypothetical protein
MIISSSIVFTLLFQGSSTRGGKRAYRIAHALDFVATRSDPKPWIGFSDITILHLALWHHCHIPGFMARTWLGTNGISAPPRRHRCAGR